MSELQVLQYRTTYINGTPVMGKEYDSSIRLDLRLKLVTAALFRKDSNKTQSSLEFLVGDRNNVWPSKELELDSEKGHKHTCLLVYCMHVSCVMCTYACTILRLCSN